MWPCIIHAHRLVLLDDVNGLVDEWGKVGGATKPDFGGDVVVDPQHVLETLTRPLHNIMTVTAVPVHRAQTGTDPRGHEGGRQTDRQTDLTSFLHCSRPC